MGRRPKATTIEPTKLQDKLICTVCGKEFKISGDTKYIINGGYTCSWKCFYKEAKRRDTEREESGKSNKRGKR